jgi:hypothetical protein
MLLWFYSGKDNKKTMKISFLKAKNTYKGYQNNNFS